MSVKARINRLVALYEAGVMTDDELCERKARLDAELARMAA